MEMSKPWPDIYNEGYTLMPIWTHSQNSLLAVKARIDLLSSFYDGCPNQHENARKSCNKMEHPLLILTISVQSFEIEKI